MSTQPTILVVLLDRHVPDRPGDEVLQQIRAAGHGCWVIMVTVVDPGLDIVELYIDDYVTKPVTRAQLTRIIENLRAKSLFHNDSKRELVALSNKMEMLEDERSLDALENDEAYQQLEDDLTELSDSLIESETETMRR